MAKKNWARINAIRASVKARNSVMKPREVVSGFRIPNHSGRLDAGHVTRVPVNPVDPVNKAYVDGLIASHSHTLNSIENPDASKVFNFGNNKSLTFTSVDRTPVADEGIFNFECSGAFTGDLVHMHQHTGNAGVGTVLLKIEYSDTDITPIEILDNASAEMFKIDNSGNLTLAGAVDGVDVGVTVPANTAGVVTNGEHIVSVSSRVGVNTSEITLNDSDILSISTNLSPLIDGGVIGAYHHHYKLSADDGTPNPALSVDNKGYVGIGTTNPQAKLSVSGGVLVEEGLSIYGQSRFSATTNTARSMANADYTTVIFEDEDYDEQGEYVHTTGIFTATVAGYYSASWAVLSANTAWTVGEIWESMLSKNDNEGSAGLLWRGHRWVCQSAQTLFGTSGGSAIVYLAVSDTLRVKVYQNQGAAVNTYNDGSQNYFQVHKVS